MFPRLERDKTTLKRFLLKKVTIVLLTSSPITNGWICTVMSRYTLLPPDSEKSCMAQLSSGEWVGKRWHPHHCVMKYYQKK